MRSLKTAHHLVGGLLYANQCYNRFAHMMSCHAPSLDAILSIHEKVHMCTHIFGPGNAIPIKRVVY